MPLLGKETKLHRELRERGALVEWVRTELLAVQEGGQRSASITAVAAATAEETYRVTDRGHDLDNDTSRAWRDVLQEVWALLEGDDSRHHPLSLAVGEFLIGPLNHNDGQDGPDDFDRPQTVAAYSAALSVVTWGTDFAVSAVEQVFEAIDVVYDGEDESDERWADVQREVEFVRRIVTTIVDSVKQQRPHFGDDVLSSIRS